ncbi:MAG TPA: triose-phosphate isomerase [Holophagaceae bacterium]|nr:triose-phosphate isomerase [Holophagaceae bacterium]
MRCVVANWKMNMLSGEAAAYCDALAEGFGVPDPAHELHVAVAPPFTLLREVYEALRAKRISVFGQNAHFEAKGAFTGEISMLQLKDAGCTGVILGHSERRQFFGETDEALERKVLAAWAVGLLPLLCVGESLEAREEERTFLVLQEQLAFLKRLGPGPLWIAYEPVWAIGTGRRADARQIREAHGFIREELQVLLGEGAERIPILYGGSVTPDGFGELLAIPEVAGALVGGASLDPAKFLAMIHEAQS